MVNMLPAVLIGGPAHAGKSVLFYSLTQELRRLGVAHHAIRACPDGEGNWSQEIGQDAVREIRLKGEWTDEFVVRICQDISRRLLPMLIDVGGEPQGRQMEIFQQCTHALLLLRWDEGEKAAISAFWLDLVEKSDLLPLARIISAHERSEQIKESEAVIEGTLMGIKRGTNVEGPLFNLLVERLATLFRSCSLTELERSHLEQAPTGLVIHLPPLLQVLAPGAHEWTPQLLPRVLTAVPGGTPLSVYGHGPHWLYSTLTVHAGAQKFYQFDPRRPADMAWVAPPRLHIGGACTDEVTISVSDETDFSKVSLGIKTKHLEYLQAPEIALPEVDVHKGLVLDGGMPSWLMTALVRLYVNEEGLPWVACYQPQLRGAVVVATRWEEYAIGRVIPL